MKLIYLTFCFFLLFGSSAFSQVNYNELFYSIDSLEAIGQPQAAITRIDQIQQKNQDRNDNILYLRATIYKIKLLSYLQEEAIASIVETLQEQIKTAKYPSKNILQSLLGEIYSKYYQQNSYKLSQRSQLQQQESGFEFWDLERLLKETDTVFKASLQPTEKLQAEPIGDFSALLLGDAQNRIYRPTLYDFLLHRALDFYLADLSAMPFPRPLALLKNSTLFDHGKGFISLPLSDEQHSHIWLSGLQYLQQAAKFHEQRKASPALADLELRKLNFLLQHSANKDKDSLYLKRLKVLSEQTNIGAVSQDALASLGKYHYESDKKRSLYYYRKLAAVADSNAYLPIAKSAIQAIENPEVNLQFERNNLAGRAILGTIRYRNLPQAKLSLYRIDGTKTKNFKFSGLQTDKMLSKIKSLQPRMTLVLDLPTFSDYDSHEYEFMLDAVNQGHYAIVAKGSKSDSILAIAEFDISNIFVAYQNDTQSLLIAERQSGKPISTATIQIKKYNNISKKFEPAASAITRIEEGLFRLKLENHTRYHVMVTHRTDTVETEIYGPSEPAVEETEDSRYSTAIFTDRPLYRPGQTVYIKGLVFERTADTATLHRFYAAKLEIKDQNGQSLKILDLKTNEFGSFSGSFTLPEKMLSGRLSIAVNEQYSNTQILIEEYVRPNFEISLTPEKTHYRLDDSVAYIGRLITFNGLPLANAKVNYSIERSLLYAPGLRSTNYHSQSIKADTISSDSKGEFRISFLADPLDDVDVALQNLQFQISVDATDQSGETQSKVAYIRLKKDNIQLRVPDFTSLVQTDSIKVPVQIQNFSYLPLKGHLTANLYSLDQTSYIKKRLFSAPDSTLLSAGDYEKYFPEIAPIISGSPSVSKQLIGSFESESDSSAQTLIFPNTDKLKTGYYQIEIKAKSVLGDTVSIRRSFYWKTSNALAHDQTDWLTKEKTLVKRGEKAIFSINLPNANVLMERYDGAEKLESRWVKTGNKAKKIELELSGRKSMDVTFSTSYQNRFYTTFAKIEQLEQSPSRLKYAWETYQTKLLPGQKAEFRLRITDEKNQPVKAEILATLYDASLDAIYQSGQWDRSFRNASRPLTSAYHYGRLWYNNDYNNLVYSQALNRLYFYPQLLNRNYEQLDLAGYNYYGGYNALFRNYQNRKKAVEINSYQDSLIKVQYKENARLIKDGFDFTGRVVDSKTGLGVAGAILSWKEEQITAVSNSFGYFRIKLRPNSLLTFLYAGQKLTELVVTKEMNFQTMAITKSSNGHFKMARSREFAPTSRPPALQEVGIRGYSTLAKKSLTGAVAEERLAVRDVAINAQAAPDDENLVFTNVESVVGMNTRKNFSETAFFHAQLQTDENGFVNIPFVMPDALTKWHFKALAHDQALNCLYLDSSLISQKDLMLQAYMPRFFRTGDTSRIRVRITYLSESDIEPTIRFDFENALTGEPLALSNSSNKLQQKIAPGVSETVEISLTIPQNVEAIRYRFSAQDGSLADAEERIIPVLSNRVLHQQSLPMLIKKGEHKKFELSELVRNTSKSLENKSLTFEWIANPNWLVVDAIPYLSSPDYEGSETIFSALYANQIAGYMLQQNPEIKDYLKRQANQDTTELSSPLEENPELKSILLQESPWLRDAQAAKKKQGQLHNLLSAAQMDMQKSVFIDKLRKLQLASGAFPWMNGLHEDRFISQHILAGIGQLQQIGQLKAKEDQLTDITDKLINYIVSAMKSGDDFYYDSHAWYALSFFPEKLSGTLNLQYKGYVQRVKKEWLTYNLYRQGLAALSLARMGEKSLANTIANSIKDRAVKTSDQGAYWPKARYGCFWYELPVETHCLMIEVLSELDPTSPLLPDLQLWLIRNKKVQQWGNSKATSMACYALLKQSGTLKSQDLPNIKMAGESIHDLAPAVKTEAYSGYLKTVFSDEEIRPELGNIDVSQAQSTSFGALHWQFTDEVQQLSAQSEGMSINRKYYLKSGSNYAEIKSSQQAKIGDRIKVVITLNADRDYEYLLLTDYRPSGTETTEQLSKQGYQDGIFYYRTSKDVTTNFFINRLRKGSYVFEYELWVTQSGTFESGLCKIESMYAPEFRANSKSQTLKLGR